MPEKASADEVVDSVGELVPPYQKESWYFIGMALLALRHCLLALRYVPFLASTTVIPRVLFPGAGVSLSFKRP